MSIQHFPNELLTDRLQEYPVLFAYLFGSQVSGKATSLSDIDLAVYLDEVVSKDKRFDLRLKLSSELSAILRKRVDLVVINDAPVGLCYEAIKHGSVIFCKDRPLRIETEIRILSRYLDRRYYDRRRAEMILDRIDRRPESA